MLVTRIAYSNSLNTGKFCALQEQARRLGVVRSEVWQRYGSIKGSGAKEFHVISDWLKSKNYVKFEVLATPWKMTVFDTLFNIRASRAAASIEVRQAICRRTTDNEKRKHLYTLLKSDRWMEDPFLSRKMRQYWKRGHSHTNNQIVVRSDDYRTYTMFEGGNVWLSVPSLVRGKPIRIPLSATVAPTGILRLILRNGKVEVHYCIDTDTIPQRPHGDELIGIDKGYTEVFTDSNGDRYGQGFGEILTAQSDKLKLRNAARAKLRSVANNSKDKAKAERIKSNNLGTVKKDRQASKYKKQVRTMIFTAVHEIVDKAAIVVAEDLTTKFKSKNLGKNQTRRLSAWQKGVIAEALSSVSERRGSTLGIVNAAYTSQVDPDTGELARRVGDKLHCASGVVWDVDYAAAINVRDRYGDPDITLYTPYTRVKQILQERVDRQRTRLPVPDSSSVALSRERNIRL